MSPTCSIPECQKKPFGRGWCQMHWTRWKRHGDPTAAKRIFGNVEARFLSNVDKTPTCWLWTGALNNFGYPKFRTADEGYGHRWSYARYVEPIPTGLQIDHVCRVRHCVNPVHLEAVTQAENIRRGFRDRAAAS